MRIGPHQLENNLIVAPMAGVTDRPFRALCRRLGAGLAVSEMVTADASLYGTRKTVRRLDHDGEPGPVSVQIVGTEPHKMAEAARVNVEHGAQIIDINMGCPAKKVCKVAAGSALMRDEDAGRAHPRCRGRRGRRAGDAEDAHRLGRPSTAMRRSIAALAEQAGIAALAVHGRTRACGYRGEAEYDTIRAVKRAVAIPVIANGDIDSPEKAGRGARAHRRRRRDDRPRRAGPALDLSRDRALPATPASTWPNPTRRGSATCCWNTSMPCTRSTGESTA